MPFITFIYKLDFNTLTYNGPKTYYGKYIVDYISDDHDGLDKEVSYTLYRVLKRKYPTIKSDQIKIGVLSLSTDRYIPIYSSKNETLCFDFYYCKYDMDKKGILYVEGEEITDYWK